jgi:hypothetical protein
MEKIYVGLTKDQLEMLKAIVSHVCANKEDAESELDICLDGIMEIETLIYSELK